MTSLYSIYVNPKTTGDSKIITNLMASASAASNFNSHRDRMLPRVGERSKALYHSASQLLALLEIKGMNCLLKEAIKVVIFLMSCF